MKQYGWLHIAADDDAIVYGVLVQRQPPMVRCDDGLAVIGVSFLPDQHGPSRAGIPAGVLPWRRRFQAWRQERKR